MKPDNLHWSKNKIMSYDALFNFVVGARGVGKTWACKYWCFSDFIKNNKRFVWVMRYATELDQATNKDKFFADLSLYFEGYQFKREGMNGLLRYVPEGADEKDVPWEICCYFKSLGEHAIKAISDPQITKIIFDEFVPNPGVPYLKNEVEKYLEFYFTISRGTRVVKAFFLANNVTSVNPYFSYFNFDLPEQGKIIYHNDIAVENVKNEAFAETMRNTRFGKIIEGTHYARYAIENDTLSDESTFVEKLPPGAHCMVKMLSQYGTLYLWLYRGCYVFISDKGDPALPAWACDQQSHKGDSEYISYAGSFAMQVLKKHYRMGTIRYTSGKVKSIFTQSCSWIFV